MRELKDRITLLGSLQHNDMLRLIESANLVVLPSIRESFGISAVESMYLGIPVIVSDVDGLAEVVDENSGVKVASNDSEALSKAIFQLMHDKDKMFNLTISAKEHVEQNFNIQICAKKWKHVLLQSGKM